MKYEMEVSYKLDLVNSVLNSINAKHLLINEDFIINSDFHHEHYVKFLLRKPHCINLELIFINNAFQINIDRTNESFEWSEKQIQENRQDILNFLKMLFTSRIKVEYYGSNYTKIYFFNTNGDCLKTLKFVTGLYLKFGCTTMEYPPIYSSEK